MSKTIVFFGNERLVSGLQSTDAPILRSLIESGYTVKAVVSHHSDGVSRNNRPLEIAALAQEHNIPVLLPDSPSDIKQQLIDLHADAGVLVAYGRIISPDIIDIFPRGIINIHPSLLPKFRGSTPIESAIISGDTYTGTSIMQLTAGMDEGPVFKQARVDITATDTKFSLYERLSKASETLLLDVLPLVLSGELQPTAQDDSQATYCALLTKEDSMLRPTMVTSEQADRIVRAYLGFPKTKTSIAGHDITITKAHVVDQAESALDIACKDSTYLHIDELIASSGRKMDGTSFLNGYAAGA